MAAENSDAMTLEQFKVYSGKNAGGGGGWELLWSGTANMVTITTMASYKMLFVDTYSAMNRVRYITGVSTNGAEYIDGGGALLQVSGQLISCAQPSSIRAVYVQPVSDGGGAVTPDVLWEGNSSQTGTFDPRPYSRLEITGRDAMTSTTTESISAPFEAGKTSEGTGRFTFYYDPFSGGTAAYIQGIEINVLKVTGYR